MYYYLFEPAVTPKDYERTSQIKALLSSLGIAGEMATPQPGKTIEILVETALKKRYSTIVAVGGIELINRVAQALVGQEAVFGIIPSQEHPDITSMIGSTDWKNAAEQLKRRRLHPLSIAQINGQLSFLSPATISIPEGTPLEARTHDFTLTIQGPTELRIRPSLSTTDEPPSLYVDFNPLTEAKPSFLHSLFRRKPSLPLHTHMTLSELMIQGDPLPIIVAGSTLTQTPAHIVPIPTALKIIVGKGVH